MPLASRQTYFVLFLLSIVLSVILWFTDSDYHLGIFKLFLQILVLIDTYTVGKCLSIPYVYTVCLYPMSIPYVYALCLCPMSMPYVYTLCLYPMSIPYVYTLCLYPVSIPYVYTLCRYPVSIPYVYTLCLYPMSIIPSCSLILFYPFDCGKYKP